ncbi:hypothetical protein [Methylobacterium oryzihabitans]|uniref:Uncharacterized protein n=1 Tax=Methylobacterium oryzihabitans TaxID=2499852 RepID=A0A437NYV2_9HYPH|nr:hypothetical protein [Methylobacterium oryzihabitans]RVU15206.1 hypothetical protein EOE48_20580 [Methylobacterium oryzihabitans]
MLAAFAEWRQTRPEARLIVGFVEAGDRPGAFDAQIGDVGCEPAELLVLANAILVAAAADAACERDADVRRALLTRIEGARACLGFQSGTLAS